MTGILELVAVQPPVLSALRTSSSYSSRAWNTVPGDQDMGVFLCRRAVALEHVAYKRHVQQPGLGYKILGTYRSNLFAEYEFAQWAWLFISKHTPWIDMSQVPHILIRASGHGYL
jgi:hypothetical protein